MRTVLVAIMILGASAAFAAEPANLVQNGGFESPFDANGQPPGFRVGPIDSRTKAQGSWELTDDAHEGAQALRVTRTNADQGFALNLTVPASETGDRPRRFLATCWVKPIGERGRGKTPRLIYQAFTPEWGGACKLVRMTEPNPYIDCWAKYAVEIEQNPQTTLKYFRFLLQVTQPGDGFILDDVRFTEVTDVPDADIVRWMAPAHDLGTRGNQAVPAIVKGNLIENSSFELGLSRGWSILALLPEQQRAAVDASMASHGDASVRLDYTRGWYRVLAGKFRAVTPHQVHTLSAWVKAAQPGAKVNLAFVNGYVPDGHRGHSVETTVDVPTDAWTRVSVTGTTEPGPEDAYAIRITASGSGDGSVYVDAVQFEEGPCTDYAPREAVEACLRPKTPDAISGWEEPCRYGLWIQNYGDKTASETFSLVTTDYWGRVASEMPVRQSEFPPGRTGIDLEVPPPGRGSLRVRVYQAGRTTAEDEVTLTVVPQPRFPDRHPESRFGQHVRLEPWQLAIAKRLGVGWVRLHDSDHSLNWDHVEPEPGKWVWEDQAIANAHEAGLEVLAVLGRTPAWAAKDADGKAPSRGGWITPTDLDAWEQYAEQVTLHYKGKVDTWEIWNEPYTGFGVKDGALYANMAKRAYAAAKRSNPDSTILGFCSWEGARSFNGPALENGALDACDLASYHCYTFKGYDAYDRGMRFREALGLDDAGKRYWMSEGLGGYTQTWHSLLIDAVDDPYSRRPQAPVFTAERAALVGAYALAGVLANGAEKVFWYWAPWEGSGSIRPDRYTWFEYDGQLKPHAAAYAVSAYFLDGTETAGRASARDDQLVACLFERPGEAVAVVWWEGDGGCSLKTRRGWHVFDMMGNVVKKGRGRIDVMAEPVYIVAPKSSTDRLANRLGVK